MLGESHMTVIIDVLGNAFLALFFCNTHSPVSGSILTIVS